MFATNMPNSLPLLIHSVHFSFNHKPQAISVTYTPNFSVNYDVHLRTKIIENKGQFEVQKLDYPCRNLVI